MTRHTLFVFGLGYTARALTRRLLAEGWRVIGTARTPEKTDALRALGVEAHRFDGAAPLAEASKVLAPVTHLLSSIPPAGDAADPALTNHLDVLSRLKGLTWIGYLSTIGVYGDQGGAWVDERSPAAPISEGSKARLAAEQRWLDLGASLEVPAHVFRLPGIYGPGRNQLEALRAGRAHRIIKEGQVFNRMHVEDIAAVLAASLARPDGSPIYNLADDEPAPASDVVTYAAELLGVAPPAAVPFEEADLPPFARHFYAECKRIKNVRIKDELGVELAYPTYREGLKALMETSR